VQWCLEDVLTYEEREEEVEEQVEMEDVETGLAALVDKYGWEKMKDTFARMQLKD